MLLISRHQGISKNVCEFHMGQNFNYPEKVSDMGSQSVALVKFLLCQKISLIGESLSEISIFYSRKWMQIDTLVGMMKGSFLDIYKISEKISLVPG